jgi:hypothetical protein
LAHPLLESVSEVIDEFPDVLTSKLGLTTLLEYDIELLDHSPVKTPHIGLCPTYQDGGIAPTRPEHVGTGYHPSINISLFEPDIFGT